MNGVARVDPGGPTPAASSAMPGLMGRSGIAFRAGICAFPQRRMTP